jgi:transposase
MIVVPSGMRIVVWSSPIDFRAGMNSLSALVQLTVKENPFCGDMFIFRAKSSDKIKILVWDGTGLWLHQKRLEAGRFTWPPIRNEVLSLSPAQLSMLLEGLDWSHVVPVKTKSPSLAC